MRDGAPYPEPFDVIAVHGVYSWVSCENRRAIVELLRRYVKPGGMVYMTYNAMPGWGVALPLQRLFLDLPTVDAGHSDQKIEAAIKFALELQRVGGLHGRVPTSFSRISVNGSRAARYAISRTNISIDIGCALFRRCGARARRGEAHFRRFGRAS